MNKWIKRAIIGSVFITIITITIGYFCFLSEQKKSREELQYIIENKYLEGKNEIGAYLLNLDFISLKKIADFDDSNKLCRLGIREAGIWNALIFSNIELINRVMNSGEYEWYNFDIEGCSPFMIIVKKSNRGFDIIGEYIIGIGVKNNFPKYLLRQTSSIFDWGEKHGGLTTCYNYSIDPNLVYNYVNYLITDKYKECLIRNEITQDEFGRKQNKKQQLLEGLVMKSICSADESLYFRTNKYFELKYDDDLTCMGTSPIHWQMSSYGNGVENVFTRTVTLHYSIQENEEVLKNEYIELFLYILTGGVILYLLMVFSLYKTLKNRD